MEAPDPEVEERYILDRLAAALRYSFPKATVSLDSGDPDDGRHFERFEVFFMLPGDCPVLDGRDIDSTLVFEMLCYQAVKAVEDRYRDMLRTLPAPVRGLGIHTQTSWSFGDEVREAEAMLGDQDNADDIPACWSFGVRFVLPIDQKTARCKTAPIHVPPELPQRAGTRWVVTPEGLIREELIESVEGPQPLHHYRAGEDPAYDADQYGYEIEEDEEEDWDR